jgi:hypothetical protein
MERRSSMRTYETIFIAHPDLVEEEVKALIDRMKGIIENLNGQLIKVDEWGRKKLAYKLKKLTSLRSKETFAFPTLSSNINRSSWIRTPRGRYNQRCSRRYSPRSKNPQKAEKPSPARAMRTKKR